ncbi:uncharacterized protein LOC142986164 [Anticarsia gemmatalis]|uniref:uncharacterized protein LOC142986164 n=1 Tax=Anticarsia gemmatalis TaxID=129554 RepID=UPI003F7631B3
MTHLREKSIEDLGDDWDTESKTSIFSKRFMTQTQNPTFQLHMVQKKETKSLRPVYSSTRYERLSFYRSYTASFNKAEITCRQHTRLNRFMWYYISNLLFKSLPHMFVHVFLASFTPEEHLFLPKMVPFCIDACALLYLIALRLQIRRRKRPYVIANYDRKVISPKQWLADIDMLAESTTAPPVVHVLTARSSQPIDPSRDSSLIIFSNAAFYIFRAILTDQLTKHCESLVRGPLIHTVANEHNYYYIYPIFFFKFGLGDLYNLFFFGFNFFTEMLTITVAYRCFIDTLVYEWFRLKAWMVILVVFSFAIFTRAYITTDSLYILYLYSKGFATLCESVFLYVLYPLGRLLDDCTFHYGVTPTRLRTLSLRLVPIYYLVKFVLTLNAYGHVLDKLDFRVRAPHFRWSWSLMLLPVLLGMFLVMYKYLVRQRVTWNHIFRPLPDWGPKDFCERQLRKQYDSRFYIGSVVPRLLSRYLISKAESKLYKIDVRYDFVRRSTVIPMEVRFKDETKKL